MQETNMEKSVWENDAQLVVLFLFLIQFGMISNLTNISQVVSNHQPDVKVMLHICLLHLTAGEVFLFAGKNYFYY